MRPSRSQSTPRWLPLAILLAIMGLIVVFAPIVEARLKSPWAFPDRGRQPLTGAWAGVLVTPTGGRLGVAWELKRMEPASPGRPGGGLNTDLYGRIVGHAEVCSPDGRVLRYTIGGEPKDHKARGFVVHAAPVPPPPDGLTLSWVRGRWSGDGAIEAEVDLFWRKGPSAISGPEYPDTMADGVMRLDRAVSASPEAACAALNR